MNATRLYFQPRTRLETVWRVTMPDGSVHWQVWTACKDRNAPFNDMTGTAMCLNADGSVNRMTLDPDGTMRLFAVMPHAGDN